MCCNMHYDMKIILCETCVDLIQNTKEVYFKLALHFNTKNTASMILQASDTYM